MIRFFIVFTVLMDPTELFLLLIVQLKDDWSHFSQLPVPKRAMLEFVFRNILKLYNRIVNKRTENGIYYLISQL